MKTTASPDSHARAAIATAIVEGANLNSSYLALAVASSTIATLGLLENSTAVIIGAMIIAPLVTAIQAIAYSALEGDSRTFCRVRSRSR